MSARTVVKAGGEKGGSAMHSGKRGPATALLLAVALLAEPSAAMAQAWLPPKGDASLTLGYQYYRSSDRFTTSNGDRYYDGLTQQHGMLGYLTYGITDRLAVSLGLPPYFLSNYQGPDPHQVPVLDGLYIVRDANGEPVFLPPTIDEGSTHGSFQDFRGELSFMALQEPLVVTPFVGFQLPSHSYDYHAQTAVGRNLWDLRLGVSVAYRLEPILPEAYVQGRYAFAYRQSAEDLRFNYSYVDLDIGYFVTPSFSLRLLGAAQIAHDGLRDEELPYDQPPDERYSFSQWLYISSEDQTIRGQPAMPISLRHDQLQLENTYNLGLGASLSLTPSVDVSAQVLRTFWGRGGRAADAAVSVWATLTFSPARLFGKDTRREARRPAPPREWARGTP